MSIFQLKHTFLEPLVRLLPVSGLSGLFTANNYYCIATMTQHFEMAVCLIDTALLVNTHATTAGTQRAEQPLG